MSCQKLLLLLVACIATGMLYAQKEVKPIIITGYHYNVNKSDTMRLTVHRDLITSADLLTDTVLICVTSQFAFRFELPVRDYPVYMSLSTSRFKQQARGEYYDKVLFAEYFLLPGDSVHVQYNQSKVYFSGIGADRLNAWRDLQELRKDLDYLLPVPSIVDNPDAVRKGLWKKDSIQRAAVAFLEKRKSRLSEADYRLLRTELTGDYLFQELRVLRATNFYAFDSTCRQLVLDHYKKTFLDLPLDTAASRINPYSGRYVGSLYVKYCIVDNRYKELTGTPGARQWSVGEQAAAISRRFSGYIREKMLTGHLLHAAQKKALTDSLLHFVTAQVQEPKYRPLLQELKDNFLTGALMTDHAFIDKAGNTVRLSDLRGKVLLLDFWFKGCGGCVSVAKALPEVEKALEGSNVQFVSLSIDKSRKDWLASIDPANPVLAGKPYAYTHYTTASTLYLNTGGSGSDNDFIRKYVPYNGYPTLLVVDVDGKLYSANPPRPDVEGGKEKLIALLKAASGRQ
ncbi:MAG: TlpA disulfide reductase family protein [Candidatus Pseudobacter hemicellulosilyticus]|uniref:TlpA disulfide reductase family protein n=1 Tax=Candidatus Pseudobacter hemicellulosilyticus TaxID=3121375 RepID=A0AAJ5WTM1_9BACT|nr:MAG: TlpA disulfide reductase family protein [Pseudobacter sp.]